jgi:putative membrane protein
LRIPTEETAIKALKADFIGSASLVAFVLLLIAMGIGSLNVSTASMLTVSLLMFLTCLLSAIHLMGARPGLLLVFISLIVGFFAEYTGSHFGWLFGEYEFTQALGPSILRVPVVIPMMWFNLTYIGYVLANLIQFKSPVDPMDDTLSTLLATFLSASLVTAYDLAADPYMVFVTKAWIMKRTDGWWFGETLQGFAGWMVVSFVILFAFKLLTQDKLSVPCARFTKSYALIPLLLYACWMIFHVVNGYPVEIRTVSAFAMGIPLLIALSSWRSARWNEKKSGA